MNEAIIANWNTIINPTNQVYILGDVSFTSNGETVRLLKRLNGIKHLIVGNHDKALCRDHTFKSEFESINDYLELKYNKRYICMFHFPIESWNRKHHNAIHLHGHMHSVNPEILTQRRMDVGLDSNNLVPYSIETIFAIMDKVVTDNICHHGRSPS